MGDFTQSRILDGSVTHLLIGEQILLEDRYTRHDRSEIVSPKQLAKPELLSLNNIGR